MKKIISVLLVILAVLSLSTVAFAADDAAATTGKVTITFEYNLENGDSKVTTIEVPYGTDFNALVPKAEDYVHPKDPTKKMFFSYWYTKDHNKYKDELITNFEPISATDGITEITFYAWYEPKDNNVQNNAQGALDDLKENLKDTIPGAEAFEGLGDFFTRLVELLKSWFSQFMLYVYAFLPR